MRKLLIRIGTFSFALLFVLLPMLGLIVSFFFSNLIVVYTPPFNGTSLPADTWAVAPTETLTLPFGDVALVADFYENELDGACAVLVQHGLGADRTVAELYAPIFWNLGCDVLSFDSRGQGASGDSLLSYGYHEKYDMAMAIDWLEDRSDLDSDQIGIIGVSYGAATALQMLQVRDDVAFIVADSPYASLNAIVRHRAQVMLGEYAMPLVPVTLGISARRAEFELSDVSAAASVRNRRTSILLLHSIDDALIPYQHSERIYSFANPTRTMMTIADWDAPHAGLVVVNEASYYDEVRGFLSIHAPEFGYQGQWASVARLNN